MKLAACLSIGLAASMFSAADAQAVRWKSQDGAISLTVPAIWAHDSAPPDTIDDAGSMVMVTWVRKPPSAKEDPLCEVYRSRVPSGVSTLPTADFVALTRQMLDTEEAQSSGLINNEIISTDRMVSGRPVIDYKTYTRGSATRKAGYPGPNLRIRTFIAGVNTSYVYSIVCSLGQTPNATATVEAFIDSVEIHAP